MGEVEDEREADDGRHADGDQAADGRDDGMSGGVVTLHPELGPLGDLIGTWEGLGAGDYPTIDPFRYHEQVTFGHVGKPFLTYQQRTWNPDNGVPMHAEVGYLRAIAGAVTVEPVEGEDPTFAATPIGLEFVLAHPTGIAEVEEGTFAGGVLRLRTTTVGLTSTAKRVRALRREFRLDGDELAYDLWMAHADTPETHHLHAVLRRTA
jgi:hypothetical protein